MTRKTSRSRRFLPRILVLFLSATFAPPSPSCALRPMGAESAGLEEEIAGRLRPNEQEDSSEGSSSDVIDPSMEEALVSKREVLEELLNKPIEAFPALFFPSLAYTPEPEKYPDSRLAFQWGDERWTFVLPHDYKLPRGVTPLRHEIDEPVQHLVLTPTQMGNVVMQSLAIKKLQPHPRWAALKVFPSAGGLEEGGVPEMLDRLEKMLKRPQDLDAFEAIELAKEIRREMGDTPLVELVFSRDFTRFLNLILESITRVPTNLSLDEDAYSFHAEMEAELMEMIRYEEIFREFGLRKAERLDETAALELVKDALAERMTFSRTRAKVPTQERYLNEGRGVILAPLAEGLPRLFAYQQAAGDNEMHHSVFWPSGDRAKASGLLFFGSRRMVDTLLSRFCRNCLHTHKFATSLNASTADTGIAKKLAEQGIGSYILRFDRVTGEAEMLKYNAGRSDWDRMIDQQEISDELTRAGFFSAGLEESVADRFRRYVRETAERINQEGIFRIELEEGTDLVRRVLAAETGTELFDNGAEAPRRDYQIPGLPPIPATPPREILANWLLYGDQEAVVMLNPQNGHFARFTPSGEYLPIGPAIDKDVDPEKVRDLLKQMTEAGGVRKATLTASPRGTLDRLLEEGDSPGVVEMELADGRVARVVADRYEWTISYLPGPAAGLEEADARLPSKIVRGELLPPVVRGEVASDEESVLFNEWRLFQEAMGLPIEKRDYLAPVAQGTELLIPGKALRPGLGVRVALSPDFDVSFGRTQDGRIQFWQDRPDGPLSKGENLEPNIPVIVSMRSLAPWDQPDGVESYVVSSDVPVGKISEVDTGSRLQAEWRKLGPGETEETFSLKVIKQGSEPVFIQMWDLMALFVAMTVPEPATEPRLPTSQPKLPPSTGLEEASGSSQARQELWSYLANDDIIRTLRTLRATATPDDSITRLLEPLQEKLKALGYRGEGWFAEGASGPLSSSRAVYISPGTEGEEDILAQLEPYQREGNYMLVTDPGEAGVVIGGPSTQVLPGQALIQVESLAAARSVTPALLKELEEKGLLEAGSVVLLYKGDLDEDLLLFA